MLKRLTIILLFCLGLPAHAADPADVPKKWHTPFGLYLTPEEAYAMKTETPYEVVLIDIRTRAEFKFVGMATVADANIPYRFLREDYVWSDKSSTYRTRINRDFIQDVQRLLNKKADPNAITIILMCQSGSRAPKAAAELHKAGFKHVYTQFEGFEGIKAKEGPNIGQRVVNGWKNVGLPWSYKLDKDKMYFNFSKPVDEAEDTTTTPAS